MLELDRLTAKVHGNVLFTLDAQIAAGDILTIMGPSGAGKSTVLNCISGHLADDVEMSGRVLLAGRDITRIPPHKRQIGLMFQEPYLFPHMSVGKNLAYGLPVASPDRKQLVADALARVELEGYADRDPATLSGGQRTRVSLMRCLLAQPRALLLDEPFSSLDQNLRAKMREVVFDEIKRHSLPCILVTHDPADAEAANGDIVQIG